MTQISIFARPYFLGIDEGTTESYLHRGESYIRGEQVAAYLEAKYNPTSDFENDIKIYNKPRNLDGIVDGSYIDYSDADPRLLEMLKSRPKLKVIASTLYCYNYMRQHLKNEIVLIPEHHCNFANLKRTRTEFTTGGIIANPNAISYAINAEVAKRLAKIGLKFLTCYDWKTRQDVVDFYQKIDFQIVIYSGDFNDYTFTRQPNKLINAASFGIPTLAKWKAGYQEFEGNYILISGMDDMIPAVEKLKNKAVYAKFSRRIEKAARKYHINEIAKLYRKLI